MTNCRSAQVSSRRTDLFPPHLFVPFYCPKIEFTSPLAEPSPASRAPQAAAGLEIGQPWLRAPSPPPPSLLRSLGERSISRH